jgi:hypothetical protein
MLAELAVYDMDVPARHAEQAARADGSAVDRFAGYVAWDLEWYRTMPFDLRGMTEDLVRSEGLSDAQTALARWHRAIGQLLQQGVEAGQVAGNAVPFVPTVIETLSWHMVHAEDASETSVRDAVELVIAAVLASSRDVGH